VEIEKPRPHDAAAVEAHRLRSGMSRGFVRDMVVSGVLPWVAVFVLQRYHVPIVTALALSTVFPIVDGIFSFVRNRRLDAIGCVNLGFIVGSIGIALWTGDVHVALLKGAALTAAFSLVCLGSLLTPKPLMFFLGRQFSTRGDPALIAEWNDRWQHARFRGVVRLITAVWGAAYACEVVARVIRHACGDAVKPLPRRQELVFELSAATAPNSRRG
jgi:hypothetical protein